MTDIMVVKDFENRVTKLEMANEINWPQIAARVQKLEEVADQARVDVEQASRREMLELRQRAEQAEAKLAASSVAKA